MSVIDILVRTFSQIQIEPTLSHTDISTAIVQKPAMQVCENNSLICFEWKSNLPSGSLVRVVTASVAIALQQRGKQD